MSAIEVGDKKAIVALKQELIDAVGRAYALGWAIARLEGRTDDERVASVVREACCRSSDFSIPRRRTML